VSEDAVDQPEVAEDAAAPSEAGPGEENSVANGDGPALEAPFDINEVPQEVREHVEKYNRQLQGEFTRKTQELAESRKGEPVDVASELLSELEEDARLEALNALADRLGFEPADEGEDAEEPESEATDTPEIEGIPPEAAELIKSLQTKVDELESGFKGEQEQKTQAAIRDHIVDGLDAYAAKLDVEQLPQPFVRQIMVLALNGPRKDGMPDMDKAISAWEEAEQEVIDFHKASKQVDEPDLTGSSGVADFEYADRAQRLARAEAVASRHS